jgi:Uncharacterized conserved protein
LTVIVNTGDDIELYGLHISPDVDILTYTLAEIVDEDKGWGIRDDTFHCLQMLGTYGYETWFNFPFVFGTPAFILYPIVVAILIKGTIEMFAEGGVLAALCRNQSFETSVGRFFTAS